jgi:chemotaxis protein methyltransferase CheR
MSHEFRARIRPLSLSDFDSVREMARSACGINLHEGKKALVSSRLERLVREHGFETFTDYIGFVACRKQSPEFIEFIDTLTTNHSGFWREPEHFLYLQRHVLPACRGRIRIWSAACATGEEPYTLAMCALDAGVTHCSIAASDISRGALSVAVRGEYDRAKIAPLPPGWRERFFSPAAAHTPGLYSVVPAVRSLVGFSPLNLLEPFGHLGLFDVIFCRNVMIYFEQSTRDRLVERLICQLAPGGLMFTGHSETLLRVPAGLKYVEPAVYRKC